MVKHIHPKLIQQQIKLKWRQLHKPLPQLPLNEFQSMSVCGRRSIRRVSAIMLVYGCGCCCS